MKENKSDWRRLKTNENFRTGDLHHLDKPGLTFEDVKFVSWTCLHPISVFHKTNPKYVFYRKRVRPMKKKTVDFSKPVLVKKDVPKSEKVVMVRFQYPNSQTHHLIQRDVQLISMDDHYVTGLEYYPCNEIGKKWKFKKFSRSRIPRGEIIVSHYGAPY